MFGHSSTAGVCHPSVWSSFRLAVWEHPLMAGEHVTVFFMALCELLVTLSARGYAFHFDSNAVWCSLIAGRLPGPYTVLSLFIIVSLLRCFSSLWWLETSERMSDYSVGSQIARQMQCFSQWSDSGDRKVAGTESANSKYGFRQHWL